MEELQQEFLKKAISNLEILQNEFSINSFSEDFLKRFFRVLHTIKGTSKTFSFSLLSKLAHKIENLVQAVQNKQLLQSSETKLVFEQSFVHLLQIAKSYRDKNEPLDASNFINKIENLTPDKFESNDLFVFLIPPRILTKLSVNEKDAINLALQTGKHFYLLKVSFGFSNFSEEFKNFKEILNNKGEVIAVAPSSNKNLTNEIGFQIFFTCSLRRPEVEKIISSYSAEIEFKTLSPLRNLPTKLKEILDNLVDYGEKTAEFLNKKISFETYFSETQISTSQLVLLNEVASHLLHNAIDHAIESIEKRSIIGKNPTAKIRISLNKVENDLVFQIEDDGSGIDIEKIIALAREKGLIGKGNFSDEKEALEIIFSQGFSTSESISEISGRGVGLDAVKDLVEKSGGRIEVKTRMGLGSTFSVYLPQN